MNTETTAAQRRGRLTLLAVATAFVLPIFLAWLLTSGVLPWLPKGRLNYGSLIEPTIDLKSRQFLDENGFATSFDRRFGEWTMAAILSDPCGADCRRTLDDVRRIRLALREEMARVYMAAIVDRGRTGAEPGARDTEGPTEVYRTSVAELMATLRAARAVPEGQSGFDQIILIDHRSRAMMIYPPHADLGSVTRDVKRLLRASKTD
ncbi:MAG: hypothetical protein NFCOHLIN_01247 [Gammaproteobacteria bacterium]|nr:hypothetical protein [Gammaproteobacteria bacterium]